MIVEKFEGLDGKKVTVMGLGVHGGAIGNIQWLLEQGAQVTVTDLKTEGELEESVAKLEDDVTLVLGEHREEVFTEVDMVLRNPAVPRGSKYLAMAREAGVAVEMDSSLFLKMSPTKNVIGVTGSKGKTTTTHAIGELLKAAEVKTVMIGVEGTSPLGALSEIDSETYVVFELSSWRLEALHEHKLSPRVAVVTSLYRDHLNTYKTFEDYVEAKKAIVRYQTASGLTLLNADDEKVRAWASECAGEIVWYGVGEVREGDGIAVVGEDVIVGEGGEQGKLMKTGDLPFVSEHERRNLLPGIFLAHKAGAAAERLKEQLLLIKPLPHRLELVRELGGVTYVNDSAATMPDATVAALAAYADNQIVLILGGNDKELEFAGLGEAVRAANVRGLVWLPGNATTLQQQAVGEVDGAVVKAATMDEAVERARGMAEAGDVVLLSPGATSFGSFAHEFARGEAFRQAVNNL